MENRYIVDIRSEDEYFFISEGLNRNVPKVITFSLIDDVNEFYHLSLGDLKVNEKEELDFETLTGNGDYFKIFNTVAWCIQDFLDINPQAKVIFKGNIEKKTRVYLKLISRQWTAIQPFFYVYGILEDGQIYPFEENKDYNIIVVAKKH
jgi:hypothetical protein